MDTFAKKIDELIVAGWSIDKHQWYTDWAGRVTALLAAAVDRETSVAFGEVGGSDSDHILTWKTARERQISHLEGLAMSIEAGGLNAAAHPHNATTISVPGKSFVADSRVFVVHGHDHGTKETAARFLEKLALETIVLHEKANEGRTVIEKFEAYADVGFAVVLLTPDDLGGSAGNSREQAPRARQNVILELGYFTGKLGRSRVCALFKPGVEVPSDFHGVLFIEIDEAGAWRAKLAQELVQAGMKVNLQGLLST